MRSYAELCGSVLSHAELCGVVRKYFTFGFVRIYAVLCGNIEKVDYLGLECALGAENT